MYSSTYPYIYFCIYLCNYMFIYNILFLFLTCTVEYLRMNRKNRCIRLPTHIPTSISICVSISVLSPTIYSCLPVHRFGHTLVPPGLYRRGPGLDCPFLKTQSGDPALRLCSTWWDANVSPSPPMCC